MPTIFYYELQELICILLYSPPVKSLYLSKPYFLTFNPKIMSRSTKFFFALLPFLFLLGACEKEINQDPAFNEQSLHGATSTTFKMRAKTWYRISPTVPAPVPGIAGQLSFANVPGAGAGNATHMGAIGVWFNQLAYSPNGQNPATGTIAAPVVDAISYPVLYPGAPLPLVQPNDFASLSTIVSWLQLPASVNGHIVWSVLYNGKGDALFLSTTTPSIGEMESLTRVNFGGEGIFVGGRGKFENASGTYHFSGYYNPQDAGDAGYSIDGSLTY